MANAPAKKVEPGRDDKGNPQSVIKFLGKRQHVSDTLAALSLWSWQDFNQIQNTEKPTTTQSNVAPALTASQAKLGEELSAENLDNLKNLCNIVEQGVKYDYTPIYHADQVAKNGRAVVDIISKFDTSPPGLNSKMPNDPNTYCLLYAKVALRRANYTNSAFQGEGYARNSVRDWPKVGFKSIGDTLPQVTITYPGVYSAEDAARVKRREEVQRLKQVASGDRLQENADRKTDAFNKHLKKLKPSVDYDHSKEIITSDSKDEIEHIKANTSYSAELKELLVADENCKMKDKIINLDLEKFIESTEKSTTETIAEINKNIKIDIIKKGPLIAAENTRKNDLILAATKARDGAVDALKKIHENLEQTIEVQEQVDKDNKAGPLQLTSAQYTQPDLTYSLPGDVIVYEKVNGVTLNEPGHIDIRTYHIFASDFTSRYPLPATANAPYISFKTIGVFRKISDTMAMVRVQAFLRIIREYAVGEKSLSEKDSSYHVLSYGIVKQEAVKGKESSKSAEKVDDQKKQRIMIKDGDLSVHPADKSESDKFKNIPAGAYQLTYDVWKKAIDRMGWPRSFGRATQDRLAIYFLQSTPEVTVNGIRRSALGYIMEGKIQEAVNTAKLNEKYPFLPGGKKAELDMASLIEKSKNYIAKYIADETNFF